MPATPSPASLTTRPKSRAGVRATPKVTTSPALASTGDGVGGLGEAARAGERADDRVGARGHALVAVEQQPRPELRPRRPAAEEGELEAALDAPRRQLDGDAVDVAERGELAVLAQGAG